MPHLIVCLWLTSGEGASSHWLTFMPHVPQTLKMQVGPASGTDIMPLNASRLTQVIKIANPTQVWIA
jgi:hypothetical protein